MYIAMNNFRVNPDKSAEFEDAWRKRESYLADVPGFVSFHLLRGPNEEGTQWYASHTVWENEQAFTAWTQSEAFRKAHAQARLTDVMQGPPQLRCWTSVEL